mmetsp:Transcript_6837/g.15828  ORF Transcript_6837/g.15828 Transcript_6837/m.15828 type:complete len:684 (+) Transcript_6837:305-2356(+)
MGKKSRKPKAGKQKGGPRKEATSTNTPRIRECVQARSPPGATCWICLCEDTEDDRLVRDCSCRGDAGWCHVSCLVSYARNKSDRTVNKTGLSTGSPNDMAAFLKLWKECMCCKQSHTNYVLMELSRGALQYCTEAFPDNPLGKVPGLHSVVDAVMTWRYNGNADAGVAAEGKAASEEIISITGELSPNSNLSWMCLAQLAEAEGTREGLREAVRCWDMMKRCNPGDVYNTQTADFKIAELNEALGEDTTTTTTAEETHDDGICKSVVDVCEQNYRSAVADSGKDSLNAFVNGIAFGNSLFENGWAIESQRFLKDLVARSRRVLGADHYNTKLAAESLNVTEQHRVSVIGKHNSLRQSLLVLSYDEGDDTYTLEKESGGTLTISRKQCIPVATPAVPVICVDLKTAKLNGKLGDATGYDGSSQRYKVYFDDKSLKPACIKRVNLRIALEIPDGPSGDQKRDRRYEPATKASNKTSTSSKSKVFVGGGLDIHEKKYHQSVEQHGADSRPAISNASILSVFLLTSGRGLEAQRLINDALSRSKRIMGPNHNLTYECESVLEKVKPRRCSMIPYGCPQGMFHVIGVEELSSSYIIQGPVEEPRREDEEKTLKVPIEDILLIAGTPVICCGLKNAAHLNGKIGDARKHNGKTLRYEVYFEDKKLKTASIRPINLRVLFELPEKRQTAD